MTERFGDRATFAVEVGGVATAGLRVVDLWMAGRRLTVNDNAAYVPSLTWYMGLDVEKVRHGTIPACPFPGRGPEENFRLLDADQTELRERFWFMRWTEILDNVSIYAYADSELVIVFQFGRTDHPFPDDLGTVFTCRIPPEKFLAVAEDALGCLNPDQPPAGGR